ncbi:MAG TPA: family 1 glycosylhydrolase, partial [Marmoricola sp.]|nr:family 1 glycosylhydrolase [Marmoricola sp.]
MSTPKPRGKVRTQLWATSHLLRSRMITLMSPGKYVGMTRILRSYGPHATTGFALAANRRPDGIGLIDELGQLTWREIQERADALAVGLIAANGVKPTSVAILCRNHRGFVDALLAAGIKPFATLYHWDLPQALQDEGGWPARPTAEAFVEYADVVSRGL